MPGKLINPGNCLERAVCLAELEKEEGNHSYLNGLKGEKTSEDFLNSTLLIPGYFQNKNALALFLNAMCRCDSLHKDFKEGLTFHLSLHRLMKENIKTPETLLTLIHPDTLEALKKSGFSKIIIMMGQDKKGQINPSYEVDIPGATGAKYVRILSHIYLQNKKDFDGLYGAAQIIGASSGDNT